MLSRAVSFCFSKSVLARQANRSFAITAPRVAKSLVQNAQTDGTSKMLHVQWKNNSVINRFPYVFLRDNCQCDICFHSSAKQRTFDTVDQADLKVEAKEVTVVNNGEAISIIWPDDHESLFKADWLHVRCLPEQRDNTGKKGTGIARKGVVLWDGATLQDKIPRFEFRQLMEDDYMLMDWLNKLHSLGITMVTNVPIESGPSRKLTDRVGYLKPTYFG